MKLTSLILLFLLGNVAFAQIHPPSESLKSCELKPHSYSISATGAPINPIEPTSAQLEQIRHDRIEGISTSINQVMVQFHVVMDPNNVAPFASIADINSALAVLNQKFAPANMEFIQCSPPKFFYHQFFDLPQWTQFGPDQNEADLISYSHVKNCLNIYLLHKIGNSTLGRTQYTAGSTILLATHVGFFNTPVDQAAGLILSHEMGHRYGLWHTNGTNQVQPGSTNELVDGSNSIGGGDQVQDTPADPACTQYIGNNCAYPVFPGNVPDPCNPPAGFCNFCDANGDQYQPLNNNLMFPFVTSCNNTFTPGQIDRIMFYYTYTSNAGYPFDGKADLMTKDYINDYGFEFIVNTWAIWASPDVWNCRTSPNCLTHEDPGYQNSSNTYNYLRVRIRNNGCKISQPATVRTYWTLGSTGENWDADWKTTDLCSLPAGREIPNLDNTFGKPVPLIQGQQESIVTFPWQPIDPNDYTCMTLAEYNGGPAMCFLSRIESTADPINGELINPTASISSNVYRSNNISIRNATLVDLPGNKPRIINGYTTSVLVENITGAINLFDIKLKGSGSGYFGNGNIVMTLSEGLWDSWVAGGLQSEGVEIYSATEHKISITSDNAVLKKVRLSETAVENLKLTFFLTSETTTSSKHDFMIYQTLHNAPSPVEEMVGSGNLFTVRIMGMGAARSKGESNEAEEQPSIEMPTVKEELFTIYPNPANNTATVKMALTRSSSVNIDVLDINGKLVMHLAEDKLLETGIHTINVDLSSLANGQYLVRMKTAFESQTLQLSVIKN